MEMSSINVAVRDGGRIVIEESKACTSCRGIDCTIKEFDLSVRDTEQLIDLLHEAIDYINEEES